MGYAIIKKYTPTICKRSGFYEDTHKEDKL